MSEKRAQVTPDGGLHSSCSITRTVRGHVDMTQAKEEKNETKWRTMGTVRARLSLHKLWGIAASQMVWKMLVGGMVKEQEWKRLRHVLRCLSRALGTDTGYFISYRSDVNLKDHHKKCKNCACGVIRGPPRALSPTTDHDAKEQSGQWQISLIQGSWAVS